MLNTWGKRSSSHGSEKGDFRAARAVFHEWFAKAPSRLRPELTDQQRGQVMTVKANDTETNEKISWTLEGRAIALLFFDMPCTT